ncbi:hypothetical protein NGA_0608000 [Nannochloropsis gaditana CCMP526]|uniref:uncharacterized protein n=1 Tax=Nannochloropsis gaditana (strain CCMP526) TaxID=1093141 RepID=UPI00029F5C21|nr:hypothetical protein NGA_0608000 [Nannochloropsis gaditana CCMP526]EKU20792.1 hypothetical protein NGA_0608000 [Nannochloropsis gaditana CCMP526]|eukprot:XP_005855577.1 hypothetical protein NGA_0608000 [Nannochloropsis gaditana CCMP526]
MRLLIRSMHQSSLPPHSLPTCHVCLLPLLLLLLLLMPTFVASTTVAPLQSLFNRLSGRRQPPFDGHAKPQGGTFPLPNLLLALRGGGGEGGVHIARGSGGPAPRPFSSSTNFLQRLQQQAGDGLDKLDLPGLQASVQGRMQHWGEHMQKHPKDALKVASVAMAAVVTGTVVKNPMVKRQDDVPPKPGHEIIRIVER